MRSLIVMMMFAASLCYAAFNGYTEDRELDLDTEGVSKFSIEAGAGKLVVNGDPGADAISVTATIHVPEKDAEEARRIIEKSLRLSLERHDGDARLQAWFEQDGWAFYRSSPWVDLDVRVPQGIALDVEDGSGSLWISGVHAHVYVDDGSGSIQIDDVSSVEIDDGSGSIGVANVAGDVEIEDGSGSIKVEHVGGSVRVDDGSGGITVEDVEHDVIVVDDGSGGFSAADVRGRIDNDS